MNKLLGIVRSLSNPSKTRTAVEITLQAADDEFNIKAKTLHLAEFDIHPAGVNYMNMVGIQPRR